MKKKALFIIVMLIVLCILRSAVCDSSMDGLVTYAKGIATLIAYTADDEQIYGETVDVSINGKVVQVHSEFKYAMDVYYEFWSEYYDCLNSGNVNKMMLLAAKTEEIGVELDRISDMDLSDGDLAYYMDVYADIVNVMSGQKSKNPNRIVLEKSIQTTPVVTPSITELSISGEDDGIIKEGQSVVDIVSLLDSEWICPTCEKVLTSNFCPDCGTIRPTPAPVIVATPEPTEVPISLDHDTVNVIQQPYIFDYEGVQIEGKYTGEMIDGFPHGYGIFETSEWTYDGDWEKGLPFEQGNVYNCGNNRLMPFEQLAKSLRNEILNDGIYYWMGRKKFTEGYICLRFYEDGLVMHTWYTGHLPDDFTRDNPVFEIGAWGKGTYELTNNRLQFDILYENGKYSTARKIHFDGIVDGLSLRLDVTEADETEEYEFVFVNDYELLNMPV